MCNCCKLIVMPLVFASILSAVAKLHQRLLQLGKISVLTIGTLLFTTLISALWWACWS